MQEWWDELPALAGGFGEEPTASTGWEEAGIWLASSDVAALTMAGPAVLCRGDTNPANYLWDQGELRMVDFEDAGQGDAVFEWADMAEHYATRHLPNRTWPRLAVSSGLDPKDQGLTAARAIVAAFWFALTVRRRARGMPVWPPVAPEEQARRLRRLLSTVT